MKYFIAGVVCLFGAIAFAGWVKQSNFHKVQIIEEIALGTSENPRPIELKKAESQPDVNRIPGLFALDATKLPIVETVSFTSRVPWMKDRPAWIADYATHYQTSRHFIARSLNRKADYLNQKVHPGDRFNVFKKDKNIKFQLVADLNASKMWFYYLDKDERVLLKTYRISIGKQGPTPSGYLTPLGLYELGSKVAIYKPGIMGYFHEEKTEMIRVFGTRWLPLKRIDGMDDGVVGLGIHGLPWVEGTGNQLVEDRSRIGKCDSDGCIRLAQEDIEEIFAIVVSKPTTLEIVKDYRP